jgi:RND family efflux transporter MFP subunit
MTTTPESTSSTRPMTKSPERIKAPLIGIIVGLGLVGGLTAWTVQRVSAATAAQAEVAEKRTEDARRSADNASVAPTVAVVRGNATTWLAKVELNGTLNAAQSAKLAFRVPGKLRSINGKVGDIVPAGHVLATLDSSETRAQLAVSEAQIRAGEAQVELASDAARRTLSLVQSGSTAEANGVQSEKQRMLAFAQLDAAKAQRDLVQTTLGNFTLAAPFGGTITKAPNGVGSVVTPGEALYEIVNTSALELATTVSEADATLLAPGSEVSLVTTKGEAKGKVRAVLATLDAQTRRVPVQVDFTNPGHLRAGAFVRAWVNSNQQLNVVRVPHSVLKPGSQDEALVVDSRTSALELRKLTYVTDTDGSLLVRDGLSANEQVVLLPNAEATTGDRVQIGQVDVGGKAAEQ